MKYSIIIPYYFRDSMRMTFHSFRRFYSKRDDYEVIIVEDIKNHRNPVEHSKLMAIIGDFPDIPARCLLQDYCETMDPGTNYNYGVRNSGGEYVVVTNPECVHETDILAGLDAEFARNKNAYAVCACLNVKNYAGHGAYEPAGWYQHSVHNRRNLNFCSAMSRVNYDRIGGFGEEFRHGYARTDCDFLFKIIRAKMPIVPRDDLLVLHLEHPRVYGIPPEELERLIDINKKLFDEKWKGVDLWA